MRTACYVTPLQFMKYVILAASILMLVQYLKFYNINSVK